jgi:two-component system, NarL family, nitrate/nitrite response regulator NarL
MPPLLPHRPKPLRILIVDDDDVFAGSLSAILSGDPRLEVVDRAANGAEGLTLALRERPDVIVLDVNMPILDGFEVSRLIRVHLPDVRIVIVSAAPEDEHLAAARRAGADVYLRKDCGFDAIEEALAGEQSRAEGATQNVVSAR